MSVANTTDMFSQLFSTFTTLGILVGVVVIGLMIVLVVKYRAKAGQPDPEDAPTLGKMPVPRGHLRTAIVSVGLSSIILGVLILGTLAVTNTINTIPADCTPRPGDCVYIQATGYRFGWNFTYANGNVTVRNLIIPVGRIVVLEISSKDVYHSFGIDDFRTKKDAIPGLLNKIWFQATSLGPHTARCFELCGSGHAFMTAQVSVVSQGQFSHTCAGGVGTGC
jgi:cytochrome c oxidase subunit II